VRGNISRYGGDPGRVFLSGHSAGAHLCAFLLCQAGSGSESLWGEQGLTPGEGVRGFVGVSGVLNLERLAYNPIGGAVLAYIFGEEQDKWVHASPAHLAARFDAATAGRGEHRLPLDDLPLLLLNAEQDFHLESDTEEFLSILRARDVAGGKRQVGVRSRGRSVCGGGGR
jgi:S-formylglutathione hydrolase FrmB